MKRIIFLAFFLATTSSFAQTNNWSCLKGGKEIMVKGYTALEKKAACELQKGRWAEKKVLEQPKQSSGGGAGW